MDIRTLLVAHGLQYVVLTIIMVLSFVQNRGKLRGPLSWSIGYLCYDIGLLFYALRGMIPDVLSFEIGTLTVFVGALAVPIGTAFFFGKRPRIGVGIAGAAGSEAIYIWFMRVQPDTGARVAIFALFIASAYIAAAIRTMMECRRELKKSGMIAASVLLLAAAVSLLRIVLYFGFSRGMTVYDNRSTDTVYFLVTLVINPAVTFALLQLLNGRLLADLERAAEERALLAREMNHRVKNSLMMAEALVELQIAKKAEGPSAEDMDSLRSQLHSIALVHERLNTAVGSRLRVDQYLGDLTKDIAAHAPRFSISAEYPNLELESGEAATLGILVNELLANAIKYASASDGSGEARVSLRAEGGRLLLRVSDKGPGFRDDRKAGLGTELIDSLAEQLGGAVRRWNDGGAVVTVEAPLPA